MSTFIQTKQNQIIRSFLRLPTAETLQKKKFDSFVEKSKQFDKDVELVSDLDFIVKDDSTTLYQRNLLDVYHQRTHEYRKVLDKCFKDTKTPYYDKCLLASTINNELHQKLIMNMSNTNKDNIPFYSGTIDSLLLTDSKNKITTTSIPDSARRLLKIAGGFASELEPPASKHNENIINIWHEQYLNTPEKFNGLKQGVKRLVKKGYAEMIYRISLEKEYHVAGKPIPFDLLIALTLHEAYANPEKCSDKGACGLWQLMPKTGAEYGAETPEAIKDPEISTRAALKYLKKMYSRLEVWDTKNVFSVKGDLEKLYHLVENGDDYVIRNTPNDKWFFVLCIYNGGQVRAKKMYSKLNGDPENYYKVVKHKENRAFALKVFAARRALSDHIRSFEFNSWLVNH